MTKKTKIAVLGGGIGSISATYELIKNCPEKYDVTVYQMGWRIGGKGASGRNLNEGFGKRIEEHGLHMWSGLYENSFRIMREAYEKLKRNPDQPLATIDDAFKKHSSIVLYEKYKGEWKPWIINAPTNDEVPGINQDIFLDLSDYVSEALQMIIGHRKKSQSLLSKLLTPIVTLLLWPVVNIMWLLYFCLKKIRAFWIVQAGLSVLLKLFMQIYWREVKGRLDNDEVRRNWMIANTAYANLKGFLDSRVLTKGLDYLDDQDYKAWLSQYAIRDPDPTAGDQSLTLNGPLVQFIYDAQFSYLNGNLQRPNIGAGGALRTVIRMAFTWRGAILWKMQGGMGDVVFTPFYEVLKKLGVKFEFFTAIDELELSEDKQSVAKIHIRKQAQLSKEEYQPLVDVKGLACWPSEPLWDQLVNGEQLKDAKVNFESYENKDGEPESLALGQDFDQIIFGIPVACIPIVAKQLVDHNPRWSLLVRHLKTVRTGALQTWWNRTGSELGVADSDHAQPLLSCYHPTPLNTMSDMTFLDVKEDWSAYKNPPKSQYYYCGPLADANPIDKGPSFDQKAGDQLAFENAKNLLSHLSEPLVPKAWTDGEFDYNLLFGDVKEKTNDSSLRWQYIRANVNPQERFTLTNTGSTKYRIRPGDSGFKNLFLAGDWTDNSFNLANIEATVMSGMLCSQAICGFPKSKNIIGLGFGCNPAARY